MGFGEINSLNDRRGTLGSSGSLAVSQSSVLIFNELLPDLLIVLWRLIVVVVVAPDQASVVHVQIMLQITKLKSMAFNIGVAIIGSEAL